MNLDKIRDIEPAHGDVCPVTGLPILRKPEWTDVGFGKDYRVTVSIVGDNILWVQPSGYVTLDNQINVLSLTDHVPAEAISGGQPYVQIEDWSNFQGASLAARRYYIDAMPKRKRISGVIFCHVSAMFKMSVKLGKRLSMVKFRVHIVDDYSEAVKLALEIQSKKQVFEDKPVILPSYEKDVLRDVFPSDEESVCPVTSLPITTKPEWTDIHIGDNYTVSFTLIGNAILRTVPNGVTTSAGTLRLIEEREKVLRDVGLKGKRYAEIRDYSVIARKPSKKSRMIITNLILKETNEGNLVGFWIFNAPLSLRLMLNVGVKLYKPSAPGAAVKDYREAVENAVNVLEKSDVDVDVRQYKRFTKDEWGLELENYGIRFELIGDDLIYSVAHGSLKEAYVDKFFELHEKVLEETGLMAKGYYYRVINWEKLEKITWKARKMYIDGISDLNRKIPCKFSVLFGLNKFMRTIIRISKQLIPFPVTTALDFEEAMTIIEREKKKGPETRTAKIKKGTKKTLQDEKIENYCDELLEFMGVINWDQEGTEWEAADDSHPFKPVYDAMAIIKEDIDDLFRTQKQIEETLTREEEKYRLLIENANDAIFIVQDEIVKFPNPKTEEMVGYSADELAKISFVNLIHPEDQGMVLDRHKKRLAGEELPSTYSFRIINRAREELKVQLNTVVITWEGRPATLNFLRDITQQKELEAQLHRAKKMEAIGTLAGGVAHDLNNILGGLVSYPELLLFRLPEDSPFREPILTIQKSGEKAAAVVQDLLTLARRGVVVTEVVNPNDVVSEYLKSPEHEKLLSYHPGVHLETRLDQNILNISGSSTHLSKTVMNLISNAAEAMPGGGKLIVSTENRHIDRAIRGYDDVKEGDYVVLTISDTGTGISPDDLEKIFEQFYTKKKMGRSGTGLGMAVVWGTVKDHNGYIDVQSTEGKGTTFTLYFPVTRKKLSEDKSSLTIEAFSGNGESILIVDDVEEQRQIASGMLKELGYSVVSVSSGEDAVEYLQTNKADLLVLDMIMDPGMDGLDTYKKILEIHPGQKAIIASGFSETDRVKEVQRLGAGAYIRKPLLLEKIGLVIKEELENSGF